MYAGQVYHYPPVPPSVGSLVVPRLSAHAPGILLSPNLFHEDSTGGGKVGSSRSSARRETGDGRTLDTGFHRATENIHLLPSLEPLSRDADVRFLQTTKPAMSMAVKSLPLSQGARFDQHNPAGLYGCLDSTSPGMELFDPLSSLPSYALAQAGLNPSLPASVLPFHHSANTHVLQGLPPSLLHHYFPLARQDAANLHHYYHHHHQQQQQRQKQHQQQQLQQHLHALAPTYISAASHRRWMTEGSRSNPPHLCHTLDYPPRLHVQRDLNLDLFSHELHTQASLSRDPVTIPIHDDEATTEKSQASSKNNNSARQKSHNSSHTRTSGRNIPDKGPGPGNRLGTVTSHDPASESSNRSHVRTVSRDHLQTGSTEATDPANSPHNTRKSSPASDIRNCWREDIEGSFKRLTNSRDSFIEDKVKTCVQLSTPEVIPRRKRRASSFSVTSDKTEETRNLSPTADDLKTEDDCREEAPLSISPQIAEGDSDRTVALPDSTLDTSRPSSQSDLLTLTHDVTTSTGFHKPWQTSSPSPSSSSPLSPTTTTTATSVPLAPSPTASSSSPSMPGPTGAQSIAYRQQTDIAKSSLGPGNFETTPENLLDTSDAARTTLSNNMDTPLSKTSSGDRHVSGQAMSNPGSPRLCDTPERHAHRKSFNNNNNNQSTDTNIAQHDNNKTHQPYDATKDLRQLGETLTDTKSGYKTVTTPESELVQTPESCCSTRVVYLPDHPDVRLTSPGDAALASSGNV
ncbi:hypothetical protein ElyMa_006200100 [Elysia marginata]|uniref:Uncharacterized protein n=1 Tax=Elysia marginata TaxID=1093978 RepID=A0AAV4H405_9GAST|nr:hypothetical protein ElyMa_006200100 [Elysia marginata]